MATALIWKEIRPSKMSDRGMRIRFINGMKRVGKGMLEDFESTTRTWDHKPSFSMNMSLRGIGPAVLVGTDDSIYRLVNEGMKPRIIRPVRAKMLRFQVGYQAKTVPGVIGSRPGGSYGKVVFAKEVHHPGFEGRKFDDLIVTRWKPRFKDEMHRVMREAIKASGHAI